MCQTSRHKPDRLANKSKINTYRNTIRRDRRTHHKSLPIYYKSTTPSLGAYQGDSRSEDAEEVQEEVVNLIKTFILNFRIFYQETYRGGRAISTSGWYRL